MERDLAIENHLPSYVSNVEPHFVDEVTRLSAKRVVPLESVRTSIKRRKRLRLAGAFGIASFLGVAVALLSIQVQQRRAQAAAIAVVQEDSSDPNDETIQSPEAVATPEAENLLAVNPDEAAIENPAEEQPVVHSGTAAVPGKTPRKEAIREPSDQEPLQPVDHVVVQDQEDGDAVAPETVGPWEERRLRRVRRLERRAARQDRNRDLLRIDEIFEGSHRPN